MNTPMNIQRFILPASIAATLHVALLWALPREEYTRLVPVILAPPERGPDPQKPEDPPLLPTEKNPDTKPVQPLSGGPTPPEIPEVAVVPRPGILTLPLDPHPKYGGEVTKIIPPTFGPGEERGTSGVSGGPVFSPGDLDRMPSARAQIAPDYPFALKHAGIDGSVLVEFDVDRTGRVAGARVLRSAHREFEEPTLRAVLKWRFEPGRRNGQAVPFRMQVPVDFHLE